MYHIITGYTFITDTGKYTGNTFITDTGKYTGYTFIIDTGKYTGIFTIVIGVHHNVITSLFSVTSV